MIVKRRKRYRMMAKLVVLNKQNPFSTEFWTFLDNSHQYIVSTMEFRYSRTWVWWSLAHQATVPFIIQSAFSDHKLCFNKSGIFILKLGICNNQLISMLIYIIIVSSNRVNSRRICWKYQKFKNQDQVFQRVGKIP